jgi:poly-gamma-glutamate synthesis protein (capsule biosynthesis protein)
LRGRGAALLVAVRQSQHLGLLLGDGYPALRLVAGTVRAAVNEFHAQEYAATESVAGNAPLLEPGVTQAIKNARETLGCNVVIPFLHWGEEMMPMPRQDQAKSAKAWIDAGATAIIGAHPHVAQTVETYRGAPIVYSLGNFVFDYYPVDPLEWTGWIAILEISAAGMVNLEIKTVILDAAGCPQPAPTE